MDTLSNGVYKVTAFMVSDVPTLRSACSVTVSSLIIGLTPDFTSLQTYKLWNDDNLGN